MGKGLLTACLIWSLLAIGADTRAGELLVGTAAADITPSQPVALDGQFRTRISQGADTPITANVVALESREHDHSLDAAVMVSCDLVGISDVLREKVREETQKRLPHLDLDKVFLIATHTHTAPLTQPGVYDVPKVGVMQVEDYCRFAADRIAATIEKAWKERRSGSFTWGLGHAAVAHNRRAVYADGHAEMYGATGRAEFRGLEGYEDHDVGTLFFWNATGKLLAIVVDVACPAQEVENLNHLNADFWHPVRASLRKRYGQDVCVLGWAGAAGDQSPHLMYRRRAEERMRQLRKLSRLEEISRRIVAAVDETFAAVQNDRHANVSLIHKVLTLQLPLRPVTEAEYAQAKAALAQEKLPAKRHWQQEVVDRYERQRTEPQLRKATQIHVLRLGDVVICTNPFELFADYGVQMKARSPAAQTFVVQLAGGPGSASYLPTERAVGGGGYSAIVQSNSIGPKGGQMLVERTVEAINSLWTKPNQVKK